MPTFGESVLVVEDDENLAYVIALALAAAGFHTETAHDGRAGCLLYSHHPTDWVVTDIKMPKLDGIHMMECIRAINPAVKTVYLSGSLEEYSAALEKEVEQFAVLVMAKPFSRENLVDRLRRTRTAGSPERRNLQQPSRAGK